VSASSNELADQDRAAPSRAQPDASVLEFGHSRPEGEEAAEPAPAPLDLAQVLTSLRETAYRWNFKTDRIDWADNAQSVLGITDMAKIERGRAFALLVDPEFHTY